MSTENLIRFSQAAASDAVLAEKIRTLQQEEPSTAARKMADLAVEAGFPVTAEELLAASTDPVELSDEQLEKVTGGAGIPANMHELFVIQISPLGRKVT